MKPEEDFRPLLRVLIIAAIILIAAVLVTSCAGSGDVEDDGLRFTEEVRTITVDGITCILASGYESIAIDCAWPTG